MRLSKRIKMSAVVVFCVAFLIGGCGPGEPGGPLSIKQAETADLTLKYNPGDVTAYKFVTEQEKSIKFEGTPSKEVKFEDSRNYQKAEIVFDQKIETVAEDGIARAEIAIKEVRYQKIHKNQQLMDYDSSREDQKDLPFGKLIGQKYTVWLSPGGKVIRIGNYDKIRRAVAGGSSAHQMAVSLVDKERIKSRHNIRGLPVNNKKEFRVGEQWSEVEEISFDMMGSKSYEKIYTVREIGEAQGRKTVAIEMSTMPTAENAEREYKEQEKSGLSEMFDSSDSFSGEIIVNPGEGIIEKCSERLTSQWTVINPSGEQGKEPSALTMKSVRSYSLERIE